MADDPIIRIEDYHRRGRAAARRRNQMELGIRERRSMTRRAIPFFKSRWMIWGLMAGTLLGLASSEPWNPTPEMLHTLAKNNCTWARAVGLAPARRGELGYWERNDRDQDGVACEPWPRPH